MKLKSSAQVVCLIILALCTAFTASAKKIRDGQWQQGTLVSMTTDAHSGAAAYVNKGTGFYRQFEYVVTHYVIDTPEYRYEANWVPRGRKARQLFVTVNGPIQFFSDGKNFYIRDDGGKQHELLFIEKIKK